MVPEGREGRTGRPITRRGGPGKSVGMAGWAGGTRAEANPGSPPTAAQNTQVASGFGKEGQYIW